MAGGKLTIKQEKYVQGLFAGLSQREAYKEAFNCSNMADKTIDENACRLANDSKVVARIEELTNELKDRNMVTVERVLSELAKVGFADIKDYLEFGTEKTLTGYDEDGNEVYGYKQVVKAKPSVEVDGSLISEVSISQKGVFSFKLHDKMAALDKMGKHLGMFTDKIDIGNKDNKPFEVITAEDKQLLERVAKRLDKNET
jgi:phage terminase small subunit